MRAGPWPWDLLSKSSEESLAPKNDMHSLSGEGEEQKATAVGAALQASPPNAKAVLGASVADQPNAGLLAAERHLLVESALNVTPLG